MAPSIRATYASDHGGPLGGKDLMLASSPRTGWLLWTIMMAASQSLYGALTFFPSPFATGSTSGLGAGAVLQLSHQIEVPGKTPPMPSQSSTVVAAAAGSIQCGNCLGKVTELPLGGGGGQGGQGFDPGASRSVASGQSSLTTLMSSPRAEAANAGQMGPAVLKDSHSTVQFMESHSGSSTSLEREGVIELNDALELADDSPDDLKALGPLVAGRNAEKVQFRFKPKPAPGTGKPREAVNHQRIGQMLYEYMVALRFAAYASTHDEGKSFLSWATVSAVRKSDAFYGAVLDTIGQEMSKPIAERNVKELQILVKYFQIPAFVRMNDWLAWAAKNTVNATPKS